MLDRWGIGDISGRIGVLAAVLVLAFGAPSAGAQEGSPRPAQAAPVQAERPPGPGLFEAVGRWLDDSARSFRNQLRGTKRVDDPNDRAASDRNELSDTAAVVGKGAAEVTIGAVEALTKLPGTRVMSGRERCAIAPNGAPDCIAAAEALCRKHGFASGKSVDFTSAEECPARALLGDQSAESECKIVTFINRAMCQ
jgi:hypothetical protein